MTRTYVIIDDDIDLAKMLKQRLEKAFGGVASTFIQGSPALEHLKQNGVPDLVLVDLQLPDMSGFELVSRIRGETPATRTPILVVSGRTGLEDHARADEVGATTYFEKPLNMKQLLSEVERLLRHGGVA